MSKSPEERIAALEREVETLLGMIAGLQVAAVSLVAKHHDHEQLVMHLATVTEILDAGSLGRTLSPKQRDVARTVLESLQRIEAKPGAIRPLG